MMIADVTELTKDQAIHLAESKWWEGKTDREIVEFQLFTKRLCMPFDLFHKAVESTLGRPVWTHEFGSAGRLKEEFLGDKPAPTFDEIINLIPEDKRILVVVDDKHD
jgi:hypothetical protein